jgi:NAD(P)-dependent dehydrogenase (short-subunit alcohol dehydrogenase family)
MANIVAALAATELEAGYKNQHILVVGGTAGIGRAVSLAFLKRGARVTIVGRREPDSELSDAKFVKKDLSLMKNAAALADDVATESFDTILFTNGIFAAPQRQETAEGVEFNLAVSYLSRFVFMERLMAKGFAKTQQTSTKPRVFIMGYPGGNQDATLDDFNSEKSYSVWPSQMNTVVANEALVTHLNNKSGGNFNAYGLNPGLIKTEARDNLLGKGSWKSWIIETLVGWFTPTPEMYAEKQLIHIIASPQLEDEPGLIIDNKRNVIPPNTFLTPERIERIVEESQKLADRALKTGDESAPL